MNPLAARRRAGVVVRGARRRARLGVAGGRSGAPTGTESTCSRRIRARRLLVFIRLLPGGCAIVLRGAGRHRVYAVRAGRRPRSAGQCAGAACRQRRRTVRRQRACGACAPGSSTDPSRQRVDARASDRRPHRCLPVVEIDTPFPVVAVVGIWRPRLFIARRVLRTCTAGEVDAMIAHESAHVSRRDNLTRLLFLCCPTLRARIRGRRGRARVDARVGRSRRRSGAAAGDVAAAAGVGLDESRSAGRSALHAPLLHASAILSGDSVEHRVRRLLQAPPEPHGRGRMLLLLIPAAAGLLAAAFTTSGAARPLRSRRARGPLSALDECEVHSYKFKASKPGAPRKARDASAP